MVVPVAPNVPYNSVLFSCVCFSFRLFELQKFASLNLGLTHANKRDFAPDAPSLNLHNNHNLLPPINATAHSSIIKASP